MFLQLLLYFASFEDVTLLQVDSSCPTSATSNINYDPAGILFNQSDNFIELEDCICNLQKCIRKCCDSDKIKIGKDCAVPDDSYDFSNASWPIHRGMIEADEFSLSDFYFVYDLQCENGSSMFRLQPDEDSFYIQHDGSLKVLGADFAGIYQINKYCIDIFKTKDERSQSALICYMADEETKTIAFSCGMMISIPFLLATFIAYALLPERNLHMKALMSYVINLMFGYLLLVINQLFESQFDNPGCAILGFVCLFFFLASFFWMNVICIDIWFTFSGLRGFSGNKSAERRRFLIYSGYAWGMSVLHVVVVAIIETTSKDTAWFNPGIGKGQCWVRKGYGELFYFYGPIAFLISINVILFAITAVRIRKIKKDTSMLKKEENKRHSYEKDKQKFNLYLKLVFAMGVNWSLEIISWAVDNLKTDQLAVIWYITDFCNAIYGVFIFFIFVFKKSIWKLLKKRYYSFTGRLHPTHSMTSNPTRNTSYSTASISMHGGAIDSSMLGAEA